METGWYFPNAWRLNGKQGLRERSSGWVVIKQDWNHGGVVRAAPGAAHAAKRYHHTEQEPQPQQHQQQRTQHESQTCRGTYTSIISNQGKRISKGTSIFASAHTFCTERVDSSWGKDLKVSIYAVHILRWCVAWDGYGWCLCLFSVLCMPRASHPLHHRWWTLFGAQEGLRWLLIPKVINATTWVSKKWIQKLESKIIVSSTWQPCFNTLPRDSGTLVSKSTHTTYGFQQYFC